jgi:hypothetical protein
MNSGRTKIRVTCPSIISLGMISLLALFLAASQPHRVHHLFENLPEARSGLHEHSGKNAGTHPAHDHENHSHHAKDPRALHAREAAGTPLQANSPRQDAHHEGSAQTECLLQSVARNSHLTPLQLLEAFVLTLADECPVDCPSASFRVFNSSPFSQRAPPPA